MKTTKKICLIALALTFGLAAAVNAQNLYVANLNGVIGEYTTNGAIINASLITGLDEPTAIAISGTNLFVANGQNGTIGEYSTSGATVNASLITNLDEPSAIAISGADLYVVNSSIGIISEYTISGTPLNPFLIGGLDEPSAIAISGTNLFVANLDGGDVGEYTTSGATVNASLITGLDEPTAIAISGTNLFVANGQTGTIGEYTTSGAKVNASLITGLATAFGVAIFGNDLYVANQDGGTVGEYTTAGATVDASLITGLASPTIAISPLPTLPVITTQPQSQLAAISSNVTFCVSASGVSALSYQWYFSNTNFQTDAGAYAQVSGGFVYDAIVTNGGSGYTTVPNVQFIGGGGSGVISTAIVSNGVVTAINIANAGSNYATAPAVEIDAPNGLLIGETNSTLTLDDTVTNDAGNYFVVVSDAFGTVTSSMAGLTILYAPSITQQPQSANATPGSNAVLNVTASGAPTLGYQWWMVSDVQSNATAVSFVTNGFVLAATVTSGGEGYLSAPPVQIVGAGGSGADGYAVVSNGMITAITITDAGSGYTNAPEIEIAAPSAISLSGQTSTNLTLPDANAGDDGDYFVVVTNNYGSITSAVATLTVFLPPQEFNISGASANGGQLTLQFTGTVDYPYILLMTTNLTPPINWQPVITNSADANGNWSFTVTNSPGIPSTFYRAAGQ